MATTMPPVVDLDDGVREPDAQRVTDVTDPQVTTASVPEPATPTRFGAGLLASLGAGRRHRVRNA